MLETRKGDPSVEVTPHTYSEGPPNCPGRDGASCRGVPPALDLKQSTAGWDIQTGRRFLVSHTCSLLLRG